MSQYIAILKLVLQLLPVVIEAVKTVEAALPQNGQGAQKLEMIRSILQSAYETIGGFEIKFEQLWPVLQSTISSVVGAFNAAGMFKK